MPFDLICLRSFVEVVERGTVAAAAMAQGYTAPAVSQHISRLERDLDTALFDRRGGRLVPTAAARALVPIAHDMLDLVAQGRAAVARTPPRPHVRIAGLASAISTVLVPRLAALDELATFEISEAEDHDALRELALGTIDVALVQEYDHAPIDRNPRFVHTALVHDPLVLVLPSHLPPTTTIDDLAGEAWLLNGRRTRCAEATMLVLSRHGISPRIAGHIDDTATLLSLVGAGRGVTIMPSQIVVGSVGRMTIADQTLGITRTILAATRATAPASGPVIRALLSEHAA